MEKEIRKWDLERQSLLCEVCKKEVHLFYPSVHRIFVLGI